MEESDLFVKEIFVDSGRVLKRIRTAPQGRAHRIKKRSNHVTLVVDSRRKTSQLKKLKKQQQKQKNKNT
jgi:large subunit ribosomal protein L22